MAGTLIYDSGDDEFDIGADLAFAAGKGPQSNAAVLTGGTINGIIIGGVTPAAGAFTTLVAGTSVSTPSIITASGPLTLTPVTDVHIADGKGLVIGHTAKANPFGMSPEFQVLGTAAADGAAVFGRFSADASPVFLFGLKSRSTTIGGSGIVQDGDLVFDIIGAVDDGTDYNSEMGRIRFAIDGTPGTNDTPGRIVFLTAADGANVASEKMRITNSGTIIIGDGTTTSNLAMTIGLSIDQRANDDDILDFMSSSVDHGMTNNALTNVFGSFGKSQDTSGGLMIRGFKDADGDAGYALYLRGNLGEAADTTKTTAAIGVVAVDALIKDGTGVSAVGADGNLFTVGNGSTTRFIFDAEGSGHADVEWVTYDSHDDIQLLRDVEAAFVPETFGKAVRYKEDDLVRLGLFGKNSIRREPNGRMRGMMNQTRMVMLHHGAIQQVYDRLQNALEAIEKNVPELQGKLLQEAA